MMPNPEAEMLRREIEDDFSLEELRTLCHDLDIRFDNLAGGTLHAKVVSLIKTAKRDGRLGHLRAYLRQERSKSFVGDDDKDRQQYITDQAILENAALLQNAIRQLDEELSQVLAPLSSFDPKWKRKKLNRLKDDLIKVSNKKEKVRHIQDLMGELNFALSRVHKEDRALLQELLQLGNQILYTLSHPDSAVTPFPSHDVLTEFLSRVGKDIDEDQAESVRQESRKLQNAVDEEVVTRIHGIYLQLRQQMNDRWQD